jgi:hypothetical protein
MKRLSTTSLFLGLLAVSSLTACGKAPYNGVDPSTYNTNSYQASAYSDSSAYGTTGYNTPITGYTDPTTGAPLGGASPYGMGVSTPYAPVAPTRVSTAQTVSTVPLTTSQISANGLVATITGIDQTGLFGLGHVTVHVEVTNPTHSSLTGRLSVQFTNGGQPTGNLYSEKLTLASGQTKALVFTSSAWKVNSAEADIEADPGSGPQSTVSNAP